MVLRVIYFGGHNVIRYSVTGNVFGSYNVIESDVLYDLTGNHNVIRGTMVLGKIKGIDNIVNGVLINTLPILPFQASITLSLVIFPNIMTNDLDSLNVLFLVTLIELLLFLHLRDMNM